MTLPRPDRSIARGNPWTSADLICALNRGIFELKIITWLYSL
jgi:hypothetical protein